MEAVKARVKKLNPNIKVIPISAKTGEGIGEWADWIRGQIDNWKNK